MKKFVINILSVLFQSISSLLCRLGLRRPKVIVYMDGGICSQLLMYIQGQYYAEYGLDVRYDLHWFDVCGMDQFHKMPRFFELLIMYPQIRLSTVSNFERKFYLLFFRAQRTIGEWLPNPKDIKHSIYLDGYWDMPLEDHLRLFAQHLDICRAAIPDIYKGESYEHVVGVHVRRGDLAKGDNPYYGGVTDGYFLRAIEFCNDKFAPSKYIFFSDEPDWVEQNICNHMSQPFSIVRDNQPWVDLWLLAHCPVIVASQGSFGKVAAKLNPSAALILCDNKYANRNRENTYYIK